MPEAHEDSDDGTDTSALVRFNTSKLEDKQNEPKEYFNCKMEDQSYNYLITCENKKPLEGAVNELSDVSASLM